MAAGGPRSFGAGSTADEVLAGLDLAGKAALVTGASGGLGEETARALCAAGAQVTIAARDLQKAREVADKIGKQHRQGRPVDVMHVELADPASVRLFGEQWASSGRQLDLLVLNAGVMACPLQRTKEGWELQFATNHLGHFLLTALVAPSLRPGARVVAVSSSAHEFGGVDFADVQFERRQYGPWLAYAQSKTANVLFAAELDRRLAGLGARAFSCHPGMIKTELARHLTPEATQEMARLVKASAARRKEQRQREAGAAGGSAAGAAPGAKQAAKKRGPPAFKSVAAGAATQLWAATAPELEGKGGLYCSDCGVVAAAEWATDPAAAKKLWDMSEELLGCSFPVVASKL